MFALKTAQLTVLRTLMPPSKSWTLLALMGLGSVFLDRGEGGRWKGRNSEDLEFYRSYKRFTSSYEATALRPEKEQTDNALKRNNALHSLCAVNVAPTVASRVETPPGILLD